MPASSLSDGYFIVTASGGFVPGGWIGMPASSLSDGYFFVTTSGGFVPGGLIGTPPSSLSEGYFFVTGPWVSSGPPQRFCPSRYFSKNGRSRCFWRAFSRRRRRCGLLACARSWAAVRCAPPVD